MKEVTLVVTSCNRHDLLERTLRSFTALNKFPIQQTVIVEDSNLPAPPWLDEVSGIGPKTWISNGVRRGQIYSVDRAYAEVDTPYIFHCEDDWEFRDSSEPGFIEQSMDILEANSQIWTVSLRANDCNGHPNVDLFGIKIQQPYWNKYWGGCCWNPGLRRLSDYRRIGSYGRMVGYGNAGIIPEQTLSMLHLDMGYRIAVLPNQAAWHIGERRSRACEPRPKPPKVLIAIPACHKYEYTAFQDKRIGHVDRKSNDRIDAIRATWAKDVSAFGSYVDLKVFYGRSSSPGVCPQMGADEVQLDVADDYATLPHKVKAIIEYALARGYDYLFKCDDDTFVYLDRLLSSGFERHGYIGYCYPSHGNYISGGPGYWLGKREMQLLSAASVEGWAEDKWVGGVLKANNIRPVRDARYLPGFDRHYVDLKQIPEGHSYISFHACTPEIMQALYEANPTPRFKQISHAIGEGSYPHADSFELNLKPIETVKVHYKPLPAVFDPRRPAHAQCIQV